MGAPTYPLDEAFLVALELGMPPAGGIALGIDRLIMVLLGATSLDEVIAFREKM
jgi:lysyl-tRNA synthetase class 2